MAVNDLARAVALKGLEADVSARLQLGEHPKSIRTELLAEGFPPEVIDHVFAVCDAPRPTRRRRTISALMLAAVVSLGFPMAGAAVGVWGATSLIAQSNQEPPLELDAVQLQERANENPEASGSLKSLLIGFAGLAIGFGLGLAAAIPTVKAISEWSIDRSVSDDEAD